MIPPRYENAKWSDVPEDIQKAVDEMPATKQGLYITGGVGVGKTHIAYGIKEKWGTKVRIMNTSELLHEIRLDFDRRFADKERPEEDLTDPSRRFLLILDDIGVEKVTDFIAETLYRIINGRYNHKIPTIFISNLTLGELADRIGERSASRIAEMCDIINLTGEDRRLK